jgi:hypothetical protein
VSIALVLGSSCTPPESQFRCADDGDCEAGRVCRDGVCAVLAASDAGGDPPADGGGAVDGGVDAGWPLPDAGVDAGDVDAGSDAGDVDAGSDAGNGDAGSDAGNVDAGALDAGIDGGTVDVDAGQDAGFDAGFDAGVDGGPDGWWDANWLRRIPLTLAADLEVVPARSLARVALDHAGLIVDAGSLASGDDIRVVRHTGGGSYEVPHALERGSDWSETDTTIVFEVEDDVAMGEEDGSYFVYLGYDAQSPPSRDDEVRRDNIPRYAGSSGQLAAGLQAPLFTFYFDAGKPNDEWLVVVQWWLRRTGGDTNRYLGEADLFVDGAQRAGLSQISFRQHAGAKKTFAAVVPITGGGYRSAQLWLRAPSDAATEYEAKALAMWLPPSRVGEVGDVADDLTRSTAAGLDVAISLPITPAVAGEWLFFANGFHAEPPSLDFSTLAARRDGSVRQRSYDSWMQVDEGFMPFFHVERAALPVATTTFTLTHDGPSGGGATREGLLLGAVPLDGFAQVQASSTLTHSGISDPNWHKVQELDVDDTWRPHDRVLLSVNGHYAEVQDTLLDHSAGLLRDGVVVAEETQRFARPVQMPTQLPAVIAERGTIGRTFEHVIKATSGQIGHPENAHLVSVRYAEPAVTVGSLELRP